MIRFENSIDINCPIEEVFSFVADFENTPKWNYYVTNVQQISAGEPGLGTTYHQVRKHDQQDYQIIDYQPSRSVVVKTLAGSMPAFERTLSFEKIGRETRIVDTWELETGYNPLLERLGTRQIKTAVRENLGKLKQLLENGSTRLQDGRISTR